ncbi:TolC family outer membrane protein [Rhizobium sp. LC145]|jgi:outer membrane protein, adhesin transport system|uniref:TolC family outer membrane protein n=1 Tax=Rhizobium sp. LC145 TaxID=1120688 RepID=UPI000B0CE9FB|nr:TolC family outer membrane protein [Rhizobium sp. LC145]
MRLTLRPFILGLIATAALLQSSCTQTSKQKPVQKEQAVASNLIRPKDAPSAASVTSAKHLSDVEAMVHRAVNRHPAVQEAAGRIKEQDEVIAEAKSGYLPSVGAGLDLGLESGASRDWGPKFNISATQMLYDFGKVSGRVQAESAVHDVRRAEFLAAVDDIIRETALAAVEIMRNEKLAGVAKEQIDDVQAIGRLVDARTDSGASTRSDKLQAQARIQAAQATELEISAQKQRWESTLNALLGTNGPVQLRSSFPPKLERACSGQQPAWETVPAVLAAKSRKTEAEARVKLARAEMLPTIALEASGNFNVWGSDDDPDYVVGIKVKGDLYNGGAFKARQNAAQYAAEASEAAVAAAKFDIQKTWAESVAQVSSLSALLNSLGSRQSNMRETRDLYQKQFLDLGTRTLLDVLNADQELHSARLDEINTRFDLYKLSVECAFAAGQLREMFGLVPQTAKAQTAR